jgi:hypothetical protein
MDPHAPIQHAINASMTDKTLTSIQKYTSLAQGRRPIKRKKIDLKLNNNNDNNNVVYFCMYVFMYGV